MFHLLTPSLSPSFVLVQGYGHWQTVYIVIIASLVGLALVLEVITWITYPARRAAKNVEKEKLAAGRGGDVEATEMVNCPI